MNRHGLAARLHRRKILAAAGSAALLPLLPRFSGAAAPHERPRRLLLVFHPNGLEDGWQPTSSSDLSDLGPLLQPLSPLASKLCIVKGLKGGIRNEVMGHPQGMQSLWTGARIESDSAFSSVPSIDQLVAPLLSQGLPFQSLELGVLSSTTPHSNTSGMLTDAAGAPLQAEQSPVAVYRRLFSSVAGDPAALEQARAQRKSVLDFAVGRLPRIRAAYGAEDQVKLEAYESGIRQLEARLVRLEEGGCQSTFDEAQAQGVDAARDTNVAELAALQRRLLIDAFTCDLTRVASFQLLNSTSNALLPTDVLTGGMHGTYHSGTTEQKLAINRFFVQQMALLLTELDEVKLDDGRSLLDDTLVVWGTEMATGNHLNSPLPFILAGSSVLPLGQQLELSHQQLRHTRLLCSVVQLLGLTDVAAVGQWSDAQSVGALPELMT